MYGAVGGVELRIPKPALPFAAVIFLVTLASAQIRPEVTPGEVVVATAPQAEIFLDDVRMGVAPSNGSFVVHAASPGPHIVRVVLNGKHPFTRRIVVTPGKTLQVRAELSDLTGDLEVLTKPGAEVLLNGKPAGVADGDGRLLIRGLSEPHYKIRAIRDGLTSEELQISLATDVVSSVNLELKLKDEVNETGTVPPPDYVLQRRLAPNEGSRVKQIFFQQNSGRLVSVGEGGGTGSIVQWDPGTGRALETLEVKTKYEILAVSPDLRWVLVNFPEPGSNTLNAVQLVESSTGRIVRKWLGYRATFAPDSKRLAMWLGESDDAVFVDIETGKKLETWPDSYPIDYSPGGQWALAHGIELTVRDAASGKMVQQLPIRGNYPAISPDGRWVAISGFSEGKIQLWEVATGRQRRSFASPVLSKSAYFADAVFTPDSRQVISIIRVGTSVGTAGLTGIRLLDTSSGREMRKWPAKDPVAIALSPDGRWLAVLGNDSSITVWKRVE
jgi:WD40-like Beta Propeller Repeat